MSMNDPLLTGELAHISLYPIKSLEGLSVQQAEVLPDGSLKYDRQFAFFALEEDRWVRAKDRAELIRIRTAYDLEAETVTLTADGETQGFAYADPNGQAELNTWMSGLLGQKVELRASGNHAWFDDRNRGRYGISLLSTGTMDRAIEWFPALDRTEVRRRMRMNIVVDGFGPFWEEAVIKDDRGSGIQIGEIVFRDPWPCSRCSVPARDSHTAQTDEGFAAELQERREEDNPGNASLRGLAQHEDFNGFFTLGVRLDGRDAGESYTITVGDAVKGVC